TRSLDESAGRGYSFVRGVTSPRKGHSAAEPLSESLLLQLGERPIRLAEREAHAAQDRLRLRELHLVVLDDLDAVSERIEAVHPPALHDFDAGALERTPRFLLVVDDEPEVSFRVGRVRASLHQRDELVAD